MSFIRYKISASFFSETLNGMKENLVSINKSDDSSRRFTRRGRNYANSALVQNASSKQGVNGTVTDKVLNGASTENTSNKPVLEGNAELKSFRDDMNYAMQVQKDKFKGMLFECKIISNYVLKIM